MNGYGGWIRNSNSISYMKFLHYLNSIAKDINFDISKITNEQLLKLYNSYYIPDHNNPNSIFYHIREPHISTKLRNSLIYIEDYLSFLKDLEGSTEKITIRNQGFDCFFIIDGFFEVSISYNETIQIQTANNKLRTINKF